jgi:hypothetical protein
MSCGVGQLAGGTYKDLLVAGQLGEDLHWVSFHLHSLGQLWV